MRPGFDCGCGLSVEGATLSASQVPRPWTWLLVTRHTVRDYLDTVVLFERLGDNGAISALQCFDDIYRQTSGASPLAEAAEQLGAARPKDIADIDLRRYRGLRPPWNEWQHITRLGRHWAQIVARMALEAE